VESVCRWRGRWSWRADEERKESACRWGGRWSRHADGPRRGRWSRRADGDRDGVGALMEKEVESVCRWRQRWFRRADGEGGGVGVRMETEIYGDGGSADGCGSVCGSM